MPSAPHEEELPLREQLLRDLDRVDAALFEGPESMNVPLPPETRAKVERLQNNLKNLLAADDAAQ